MDQWVDGRMDGWKMHIQSCHPAWLITIHLYCAPTSSLRTLSSDGNIYPVLILLSIWLRDDMHASLGIHLLLLISASLVGGGNRWKVENGLCPEYCKNGQFSQSLHFICKEWKQTPWYRDVFYNWVPGSRQNKRLPPIVRSRI